MYNINKLIPFDKFRTGLGGLGVMVFNATFNNISVISWGSIQIHV